jgi:hypothetical protein
MNTFKIFSAVLAFGLLSSQSAVAGRADSPTGDYVSSSTYVSSAGVASGDINMNGSDITGLDEIFPTGTGGRFDCASGTDGRCILKNGAGTQSTTLTTDASSNLIIGAGLLTGTSGVIGYSGANAVFGFDSSNISFNSSMCARWFSTNPISAGSYDLKLCRTGAGKLKLDNGTVGINFVATADTLTLRNLADNADATFATGAASFSGVASLTGGAKLPVQTAAVPVAPTTCDASGKGRIEVVDDNNDTAATQVCYCGMTDDSTYDWLNIADNTACSFY